MKKLFKIITVIILLFYFSNTNCNLKKFYGTLIDENNKEILIGAKIQYSNKIYYSDFNGQFPITSLDYISIELISYEKRKVKLKKENAIIQLKQL